MPTQSDVPLQKPYVFVVNQNTTADSSGLVVTVMNWGRLSIIQCDFVGNPQRRKTHE